MYEILRDLPTTAWALDLGSALGSFDASRTRSHVVRVDLEFSTGGDGLFVQSNAASLPFRDSFFDAVIANHSLEHFDRLNSSVREIGRVIKPSGSIFISVPDASTVSDKLYRWLARGGGHVNAFTDSSQLAELITSGSGLAHAGTRILYSGFSFLNRKNTRHIPKRLLLLGGGYEFTIQLATYCFRLVDRIAGARLSVYGWACYFGAVPALDLTPCTNVCVRCGSGHGAAWLGISGFVKKILFLRHYNCPGCGATNLFTSDPEGPS